MLDGYTTFFAIQLF